MLIILNVNGYKNNDCTWDNITRTVYSSAVYSSTVNSSTWVRGCCLARCTINISNSELFYVVLFVFSAFHWRLFSELVDGERSGECHFSFPGFPSADIWCNQGAQRISWVSLSLAATGKSSQQRCHLTFFSVFIFFFQLYFQPTVSSRWFSILSLLCTLAWFSNSLGSCSVFEELGGTQRKSCLLLHREREKRFFRTSYLFFYFF